MADLQARADGAQDKHGLRSEPRPCELCGQLVVSVCDSLDMGEAVTCHYEPATEDEKAKRIAELEAELAALRSRLEFTSCQKADVEALVLQPEGQNAALRQDAEVGRAIREFVEQPTAAGDDVDLRVELWKSGECAGLQAELDNKVCLSIVATRAGIAYTYLRTEIV